MRVSGLLHISAGLLLAVVIPGEALAQYDFPIEEWANEFDGYGNGPDHAVGIVVDEDGNSYVAGSTFIGGDMVHDYEIIKYETDGDLDWEYSVGFWIGGTDTPADIDIDSGGYTYLTGESEGTIATIKMSPSGSLVWSELYEYPSSFNAEGTAIALDASGNVYVTGFTKPDYGGNYDYVTLKYNSSGTLQWATLYNGPGNGSDQACDLEVDAAGNVYVTGFSMGTSSEDYATIKYNSAGVQQWVARYNGPGDDSDLPCGIELDSYGNVYVTGESPGSDDSDVATVRYSNSGAQLWVARYDLSGWTIEFPTDIGIGPDGSIYVAGEAENDLLILKYQSSGTLTWSCAYAWPYGGEDCANALAINASGDVFAAGYCLNGQNDTDFLTVRYSSSGQFTWAAVHSWGAGDDEACDIALDEGDGIYITGSSGIGGNGDFGTIKYDANTGIGEHIGSLTFGLSVSPNPASSAVTVEVSLEEASDCEVRVFDFQGRIVETIQDGGLPAGRNQLTWDAQNFPAGVYFIRAENDGLMDTERLVLIR